VIVVDASVVVDAITGSDRHAERIRDRLEQEDELAAPHLLDLEVLQALRRLVHRGELTAERGTAGVQDLAELALSRFAHEPFIDRIWELREMLSGCDAAYLALAEAIAIPLVTCDAALASVAGESVEVELYPPGD